MSKRLKLAEYLHKDPPTHPQVQHTHTKSRLERLVSQVEAATNIVREYKNKEEPPSAKDLRGFQSPPTPKTIHLDQYQTYSINPREKSIETRSHSNHKVNSVRRTAQKLNIHKRPDEPRTKVFSKMEYKVTRVVKEEGKNQSFRYNVLEKTLNSLQSKVLEAKSELVRHNINKDFKNMPEKVDNNESQANSEISNAETIVRSFNTFSLANLKKQILQQSHPPKRQNTYYISQLHKNINKKHSVPMKHLKLAIQCAKFMKQQRKHHQNIYKQKKLHLQKKEFYKNKKTIVFDLDETLVHCDDKDYPDPDDIKLSIMFPTGEDVKASIAIRPHALGVLDRLSQKFELIVFAGGLKPYAKTVLDFLDPEGTIFQHRIYKESCYELPEGIIKDLRILNRNLSDVVLVDNSPFAYSLQPQNGIPILPYQQGKSDNQLKQLQQYLLKLQHVSDVRQLNLRTFKLNRYADFDTPEQLISNLYPEK